MGTSDRMKVFFLCGCCRLLKALNGLGVERQRSEKPRCGFQVTSTAQICPGVDRKLRGCSSPLNVLENSVTLRSVVLHLPVVTSSVCPRTETPLREAADFFKSWKVGRGMGGQLSVNL